MNLAAHRTQRLSPEIASTARKSRWLGRNGRMQAAQRSSGKVYFSLALGLVARQIIFKRNVIYLRHNQRILLFRAVPADLARPSRRESRPDPARPSDLEGLPVPLFQYHPCHPSRRTGPAVLSPLAVLPHPEILVNLNRTINRDDCRETVEAPKLI